MTSLMKMSTKPAPKLSLRGAAFAAVLLATAMMAASADKDAAAKTKARDLSKGNTLYVVPYAHLDTQWRWAYPQVIREFIANTLHDNFALIEKYPHYVFNFSGSRRYEMMKEYYPADYEKLKGYISAGRWFPCGSSVDEGDANVPSAESLVRHVLYGNHYFKKEFGVVSQEFMLPDCFGFPYALPSILAHCGIKGFSTQKLTWGSAVGIPFKVGRWYGPDGKMVVAALDPGSYSASIDEDLSQNTSWLARIQNTGNMSGAFVDYHYYGTGDRGGAPTEGSVQWIEKSIAGGGPISVISTRADAMFTALTQPQIAKLPSYNGELLLTQHSAGSVTSQAYMKRWNRKNEQLANAAETASVAASWLGNASYPSHRLYTAWDLLLGSQMHDMLPGTSIPKAYEFCWNDELLALNQFGAVAQDGVGAVAASMDTRVSGTPLVVYNPLSTNRQDVVEAKVPGYTEPLRPMQVYGPDGNPVPTQTLGADVDGTNILFLASAPSTGFAVYNAKSSGPQMKSELSIKGRTLENAHFKVTVNKDGDIGSIYDKTTKHEILKSPVRLAFQYHNPSQFPAWNMDWQDAQKPPYGYVTGPASIAISEDGPVRVSLFVQRQTNGSKFSQTISLSAGSAGDRVEVANQIDWQTKETALKASFSLNSSNPEATYDLQLGAIKRGNNNERKYEVPQHQWFDLTKPDGSFGTAILNDSKFASDKPNDDTVQLTMIYTPGVRGGYRDQATQDFGRHDILFAIAPHAGTWQQGNVEWTAKRLNQPLRAFVVQPHTGPLGKVFSLFRSNTTQVEISAIKKAEDSDEVVVRLRELTGKPAKGVRISASGEILSAREISGQEAPVGAATVKQGVLVTDVSAYSLKAFALKLAPNKFKAPTAVSTPVALPYNADVASPDGKLNDGSFDATGRTIAAELLPKSIANGNVNFVLGSTANGAKNAVVAQGQKIAIPAGYQKLYVLAASSNGDVQAQIQVGSDKQMATIQDWGGYIGQWDNRLWAGDPGPNFSNYGEMAGLVPAFVKTGEVAWYASHRHHPVNGNEFYAYTYLYKIALDIPTGAKTVILPKDSRIHIMAMSVGKNLHEAMTAAPLYDTLEDHRSDGYASISPSQGSFNNVTMVSVQPPLYWKSGGIRYTLDGTNPSMSSAIYKGPFQISDPTTVKVAMANAEGMGPVTTARLDVHDTTPPEVVGASSPKMLGLVRVLFSEALNQAVAEDPSHYRLSSGVKVTSAKLRADRRSVELSLDQPLQAGKSETITVAGIKDLSRSGNPSGQMTLEIAERGAVYTGSTYAPHTSKTDRVDNLPVKAKDAWTVNLFCKIDHQPDERVIIGGFGRAVDGRTGTGRYFTNFPRGINFWVANEDIGTTTRLDIGKWQMLTATYDGMTLRVYKNGELIGSDEVELADDQAQVHVMPIDAWERKRMFDGEVRDMTIWDADLTPAAIRRMWQNSRQ